MVWVSFLKFVIVVISFQILKSHFHALFCIGNFESLFLNKVPQILSGTAHKTWICPDRAIDPTRINQTEGTKAVKKTELCSYMRLLWGSIELMQVKCLAELGKL